MTRNRRPGWSITRVSLPDTDVELVAYPAVAEVAMAEKRHDHSGRAVGASTPLCDKPLPKTRRGIRFNEQCEAAEA
jgi:hypothetical protein